MLGVSHIIGLNASSFAYFFVFRNRLKLYLSIPLTIISFFQAKNLATKSFVERVYKPIEPIYEEIRQHQTVTSSTPTGAKGVRELKEVMQQSQEIEKKIPIEERTDLSEKDKMKFQLQNREKQQSAAVA